MSLHARRSAQNGFAVRVKLLVAGNEAHAAVERVEQDAVARIPDIKLHVARVQQKLLRLVRAEAEPDAQAAEIPILGSLVHQIIKRHSIAWDRLPPVVHALLQIEHDLVHDRCCTGK